MATGWIRRFTALVVAALLLDVAASTGPVRSADQIIKIGVDLPLSGGDATQGIPTQNGVVLALEEVNRTAPPGVRFVIDSRDDCVLGKHSPQQGVANVRSLASDPSVLGVIGPYNSNVAAAEIPLSNALQLPLVSPDVTNPALTTAKYRTAHPDEIAFFRVGGTDDRQGKAGAAFARQLGFRKVYIIDDGETYGAGLAAVFDSEFRVMGGTVLGHDHITANQQDFTALLTKIASMHPDALYYGGDASTGGAQIRRQMGDAGMAPSKVPFEGGDGISNAGFREIAGAAANNSYYTVAAPDVEESPEAQAFVRAYRARFHSDLGPFSANAYVATLLLTSAIETAMKDVGRVPTRADVLRNLRGTKDFKLIIGTFSFDQDGNNTNPVIALWKVENDRPVFVRQSNFSPSR